eukprot:scaffold36782_cov66-Phaeocystis_antarctica.AAC.3
MGGWGTRVTLSTYAAACDACIGATIVLPIASWERRFIEEQQLIDMAEGDDTGEGKVEIGSAEDGGDGSADGVYSMMLMSSTHHRFAGLFTIQRSGASPVTQLLVRGSPA